MTKTNTMVNLDLANRTASVEDRIAQAWSRNVFFLLWHALILTYFVIAACINRICRLPRIIHNLFEKDKSKIRTYFRQPTNSTFIQYHNDMVDSNIFNTLWFAMVYTLFGLSKLTYHIGKVIWWIIIHIIGPVLKWFIVMLGIMMIADAIKNRNTYN